jgi:hypothetical protein
MEQKQPLVKKILNIFLEIISGFILLIPFILVVQSSPGLHQWLLEIRQKQEVLHMTEQMETMAYLIYCLALPYLCWLAGKNTWRSKNLAKGFATALLIHSGSVLFLFAVFILGPVD